MRKPFKNGFSLVEVLVAAALLSLSIVIVIAVIKNGRALDINDLHRRQARAIINGVLGSPHYDYTNYVYLRANPAPPDTTVTLDIRDGSNPLTGTLKTQIIVAPANGTIAFDVVRILMTIIWQETGFEDSIVIEKWITDS